MATIQYSDLDIKERVGAGGFAAVCKGIWKSKNMTVAIKTFPAVIPTTEVWFHPIDICTCTSCLCVCMTLRFHVKVYTLCSVGSKLPRAQFFDLGYNFLMALTERSRSLQLQTCSQY